MTQPATIDKDDEASATAAMSALFQFLLFLGGIAVGTMSVGAWSLPVYVLVGIGLSAPIALVLAESSVRRNVNIPEGRDVVPDLHGVVASLVAIAAAAAVLSNQGDGCCVAFFFAPVGGLALHNFMTAIVVGAQQLRQGRARRLWTRVEVLAFEDGIATLHFGDVRMQVQVAGEVPLGIAYADVEESPAGYRIPGVPHLRAIESEQTRRVRRALAKLALVRLGSALMWVAVLLSPFTTAVVRELHQAW